MLLLLLLELPILTSTQFIECNGQEVYKNGAYNQNFLNEHPSCCTPPTLYSTNITSTIIQVDGITITSANVHLSGQQLTQSDSNNDNKLTITFDCGNSEGSGLVNVDINHQYKFAFWYRCDTQHQYIPFNFDWSMMILLLLACLDTALNCRWGRIISIKLMTPAKHWLFAAQDEGKEVYFQGFQVTYFYFIVYFVIVGIFYLIGLIIPNNYYVVFLVISCLITFILSAFYINEWLTLLKFSYRYRGVRVRHFVSLLLSLGLILAYILVSQPFYLSFIIALLANGALLKLFKITSLKIGTIILGFAYIYDFLYYVLINIYININYQQYTLQYLNYPWLFQIPLFHDTYLRVCNQISVVNLVLPGLTMCYLTRYDQNYETKVYATLSFFSLFVGEISWFFLQLASQPIQIPQSVFVFPLLIGSTSLWAYKSGIFTLLWKGRFYDKIILDPFSVQLIEQSHFDANLESKYFEGLRVSLKEKSQQN